MTAWTPFNINHPVRVKVTERGERVRRAHWLTDGIIATPLKRDADGWTEMQMWEVMQTFGGAMIMGMSPPFETEILIGLPEKSP